MPKNQKSFSVFRKLKPYLIGLLKGLIVFGAGFSTLSFIMLKWKTDAAPLYYLIYLFIVLGGFVCGISAYKRVGGRGFFTGIVSSVPYGVVVFLIIASVLRFNISGEIFFLFPLILSGGFLGGITAANTRI